MIRDHLKKTESNKLGVFRLRGLDNTRIEALSDGVFALSIGLLIISSAIPERFDELMDFMNNFIPFGATIAILTQIWYQHYLFFVRYGLKDAKIVAINGLLLFLILFFTYPLKFLMNVLYQLFSSLIIGDRDNLNNLFTNILPAEESPKLMVIYGLAGASIFLTLAWMYWYAYRLKTKLDLDELERYETMSSIQRNIIMAMVPLLSTFVAYFELFGNQSFMVSGFMYMLYIPSTIGHAKYRERRQPSVPK